MKELTKEQKKILTTNLEKVNETIIINTLSINGNHVMFYTVNGFGTIKQYFVDFELKSCLVQILSSVYIHENYNPDWFKF